MKTEKLQPVIWMLFLGVFLSVGAMFYHEHHFKDDGQLFQVIAGLIAGFSGSLFTLLKSAKGASEPAAVESVVKTPDPS